MVNPTTIIFQTLSVFNFYLRRKNNFLAFFSSGDLIHIQGHYISTLIDPGSGNRQSRIALYAQFTKLFKLASSKPTCPALPVLPMEIT